MVDLRKLYEMINFLK